MPNDQQPFPFTALVVRTVGDPARLEKAIREQIRLVDSDQGVAKVELMQRMVLGLDCTAAPGSNGADAVPAVIALGLASIGLYRAPSLSLFFSARERSASAWRSAPRERAYFA